MSNTPSTPSTQPNSPTYLFLDLETTGLDAARCSILEVAGILAAGSGVARQEVINTPICYPVAELGRLHWDSAAYVMHTRRVEDGDPAHRSLVDILGSGAGLSLNMAEDRLLAAVQPYPARSVILAGNSIHFDQGFLKHHMPRLYAALHYRLMDVSSLIGFFEDAVGIPRRSSSQSVHRAMADIRFSLECYMQFRRMTQEAFAAMNVLSRVASEKGAE